MPGKDQRSEQLALLVDHVQDYAIFMLDPGGHVATWNPGAERIKGYHADEIIGRHFSTFYTPDAIARDHPAHELEVATAEGRFEEEGWRVRKDGTPFWANVVITAIRDARAARSSASPRSRATSPSAASCSRTCMRSNADLQRFAAAGCARPGRAAAHHRRLRRPHPAPLRRSDAAPRPYRSSSRSSAA